MTPQKLFNFSLGLGAVACVCLLLAAVFVAIGW